MKWRERVYLPYRRPAPPPRRYVRRGPAWRVRLKQTLLGRPLSRHEMDDQLVPKRYALPLFASDPLSSVAYATEEIMLVLVLAGSAALSTMLPIAAAISLLVIVVVASYRQTVRAYPTGGGAYLVTRDNLGDLPARVAASALLSDYVLTVAVSVTAGVAAITSAWPSALGWRVPMAVGLVAILAVINLRGVRETSRVFALPTYAFFITVMAMLITGFVRCVGGCPKAASSALDIAPEVSALTAFLVLRAFASGSTALTGIEAIADGVAAFRRPSAKNAATTLAIMAAMSLSMFIGITVLAHAFGVRITEATADEFGSVISQVGRTAFGVGPLFYVLQVTTVGILVLAANTAFQDFPRLSAILAADSLMPRQMRNRGDRLVFSNGVVILSGLAVVLIVVYDASLTRLIQLYVVGVFTSFTLSQTGMIRHWRRVRTGRWRRSASINAIGAATTGVVLVVIASVKFTRGAWTVVVAVVLLVLLMGRMRKHYEYVALQLRTSTLQARAEAPLRIVLAVSKTWPATNRAIKYAEMLRPSEMHFVHVKEAEDDDFELDWETIYPDYPLTVITPRRWRLIRPLRGYLRDMARSGGDGHLTVIVPEVASRGFARHLVGQRKALLIKTGLLFEEGIAVIDLVYVTEDLRTATDPPVDMPSRHVAVVPVGDLSTPSRNAIAFAKATRPEALHVVHVEIDPERTAGFREEVERSTTDVTLEVLPSPFRSLTEPLVDYVRRLRDEGPPGTIVTMVIPEFIVPGALGKALHNQSALALKSALLLEPDVAVASVPWHLIPEVEYGRITEHQGLPLSHTP